jgi:hypothetical protein
VFNVLHTASQRLWCVTTTAVRHSDCGASQPLRCGASQRLRCVTTTAVRHGDSGASQRQRSVTATAERHSDSGASQRLRCVTATPLRHYNSGASQPMRCVTATPVRPSDSCGPCLGDQMSIFEKIIAQNAAQTILCQNKCITLIVEKCELLLHIILKTGQSQRPANRRKLTQSGHPVPSTYTLTMNTLKRIRKFFLCTYVSYMRLYAYRYVRVSFFCEVMYHQKRMLFYTCDSSKTCSKLII